MYPAERQNQPEWFIVLGGTSAVGQYGIKVSRYSTKLQTSILTRSSLQNYVDTKFLLRARSLVLR